VATAAFLAAASAVVTASPEASAAAVPTSGHMVDTAAPVGKTIACSNAVSSAPTLSNVQTNTTGDLLDPFGVAISPDSTYVFVDSLITPKMSTAGPAPMRSPSGVSVYSFGPSGLVLRRAGTFPNGSLVGMSLSENGRLLAAANDSGASIFSVSRMEQSTSRSSSWLLGSFVSGGHGAIETTFSHDGHYVFVTLEDSDQIAVFNLREAQRHTFDPADFAGAIPLGVAPVGMAVSPNGRYLYATSETASSTDTEGTLTTIDIRRAERDPSHSVISTVWAGCSPVRVAASSTSVYVTARGSDALGAFSAADLVTDPGSAMTGQIAVGESPVGLALVAHDSEVVIADSNRFDASGVISNLAVVALKGAASPKLLGYVDAGAFPRDMTVSPDGKTLIVSDFDAGDVEELALNTLPSAP
jgi:DNA-binding beta-propeller fold protein YncE